MAGCATVDDPSLDPLAAGMWARYDSNTGSEVTYRVLKVADPQVVMAKTIETKDYRFVTVSGIDQVGLVDFQVSLCLWSSGSDKASKPEDCGWAGQASLSQQRMGRVFDCDLLGRMPDADGHAQGIADSYRHAVTTDSRTKQIVSTTQVEEGDDRVDHCTRTTESGFPTTLRVMPSRDYPFDVNYTLVDSSGIKFQSQRGVLDSAEKMDGDDTGVDFTTYPESLTSGRVPLEEALTQIEARGARYSAFLEANSRPILVSTEFATGGETRIGMPSAPVEQTQGWTRGVVLYGPSTNEYYVAHVTSNEYDKLTLLNDPQFWLIVEDIVEPSHIELGRERDGRRLPVNFGWSEIETRMTEFAMTGAFVGSSYAPLDQIDENHDTLVCNTRLHPDPVVYDSGFIRGTEGETLCARGSDGHPVLFQGRWSRMQQMEPILADLDWEEIYSWRP